MKTTFTLISILTLSLLGMDAKAAFSKLHLNLFNDGNFVVVVDGMRYQNVSGQLRVPNLRAGTHHIKVVEVFGRQNYGRRGGRVSGREVLYNGSINIPYRSAVFAHLTNDYRIRISNVQQLQAPRQRVRNHPRRRGPVMNNGVRRGNQYGLTLRLMENTAFDNRKLQIARNYVRGNRVTSAQVAGLMNTMAFDRNKLELAQFAYRFIIDKNNYFLVNRSFTFDSSVRKLNRFLRGQTVPRHRRR